MRRFTDADAREWEVVVGRESWGAFVALFIPVEGSTSGGVWQATLRSASFEEATAELESLDQQSLEALLRSASVHTLEAGE